MHLLSIKATTNSVISSTQYMYEYSYLLSFPTYPHISSHHCSLGISSGSPFGMHPSVHPATNNMLTAMML
jgi:hypothetical protein